MLIDDNDNDDNNEYDNDDEYDDDDNDDDNDDDDDDDEQMSETKLYNLFSPYVPIHSITFPIVEKNGQKRSSGYAFIQCYCNQDVEDVIAKMNGTSVNVGNEI